MEGKAAVLGEADFVMPFSALGLETFAVEPTAQDVSEKATTILKEKYALVVVAENIAPLAEEAFEPSDKKAMPCIVVVPFTTESEGYATKALGKVLKMATGIDIIN